MIIDFGSKELCTCGHLPLEHGVGRGWHHTGIRHVFEWLANMGIQDVIYPCQHCKCHTFKGSGKYYAARYSYLQIPWNYEPEPEEIDISSV